jgi:hypothetical protein
MKTNELRKGLYFNVPRKDQCPFRIDVIEHLSDTYAKVGMSSGTYKLGEIEMEAHPLTWELKDLEPIPLNEELLLKMGASKERYVDGVYTYKQFMFIASKHPKKMHFDSLAVFVMNYGEKVLIKENANHLHEIQNIIHSLTGEVLIIKENS